MIHFFDTETIGLHGLAVTIQWARDDGPVNVHDIWLRPLRETVELIDSMRIVVGFNLAFDWFHLCKWRTIAERLRGSWDTRPIDMVEVILATEPLARDGKCLKPEAACDLQIIAAEGANQAATLEHKMIRVRSIPNFMSQDVCDLINEHVQFPDIYFARKRDARERFKCLPGKRKGFDDIVLSFAPSNRLKDLYAHLTGKPVSMFKDISPESFPEEVGYAPFGSCTPEDIHYHVTFWRDNGPARKYAADDVTYTREIWQRFGRPEPGDYNSNLACMVGAVRWHGFSVDLDKVAAHADWSSREMAKAPRDPRVASAYLQEVMDPVDWQILGLTSTSKQVLKDLSETYAGTEVGSRALMVLEARQAKYEHDMCSKLLRAGRFHASAKVVGTLSGRKSGAGGDFNSQGIPKKTTIRQMYTLSWPGTILSGGDFESFEVAITDGFFRDPVLHDDLSQGRSIHAIFGTFIWPEMSYEEILATKGTNDDRYKIAKSAVFLTIYGGSPDTYKRNLGISLSRAEEAYRRFCERYQVVGKKRQEIFDQYEMLHQPGGRGSQVLLKEPARYDVESLLGFKRDFSPEFETIRAIYEVSNIASDELAKYLTYPKVVRSTGREQTPVGATMSSLYAAAFGIQGSIQRAANNTIIQSTGAEICKRLESALWEHQPAGFCDWVVAPLNMHDEVMCAHDPRATDTISNTVSEVIEKYRPVVPLIGMEWETNLGSWGG